MAFEIRGSLKVRNEAFDPEQYEDSPRIGSFVKGDRRLISAKKKNRVSYRKGEDEIIPRSFSNEHKIFENKRVK